MPPAGNWGRCGCPDAHPEPAQLLPRTFWRTQQRKSSSERDLPAEGNARMGFPPLAAQGAEAAPAREKVTDAAVPKCLSPGRRGQPAPVARGDTGSCHPLSRAVGWGVPNRAGAECGDSSHRSRLGFLLSAGFGKVGSWLDSMILGVCS